MDRLRSFARSPSLYVQQRPGAPIFKPFSLKWESNKCSQESEQDPSSSTSDQAQIILYSPCPSDVTNSTKSSSTVSSESTARSYTSSLDRITGCSNNDTQESPKGNVVIHNTHRPCEERAMNFDTNRSGSEKWSTYEATASRKEQMTGDRSNLYVLNTEEQERMRKRMNDAKRSKLRGLENENESSPRLQNHSNMEASNASSTLEMTAVHDIREEFPSSDGVNFTSGIPPLLDSSDFQLTQTKCRSVTTSSILESLTDSESIETDWEDDSESEHSSQPLQFQLCRLLQASHESKFRLPQESGSSMKSTIVEDWMSNFSTIFDRILQDAMRQRGSSGQSTGTTTASGSGTTSQYSASVRQGKRGRDDEGEGAREDDHHERRRKRAPVDKLTHVPQVEPALKQFACPFRKHDPRIYSIQNWPRCAEKPFKTIARLKTHLYQHHLIEQCRRCKLVFDSEAALEEHVMDDNERCEKNTNNKVNGMTRIMKDQIQSRRKLHPGQTEGEKWEQIYKTLFPNESVPSPDFEPVPDHQMQTPHELESINIAQCETYLRRVLPGMVRNSLEEVVRAELQPVEAQLQRRMMDIVQDSLNQAFINFREIRRLDLSMMPSLNTSMDVASPTSHDFGVSLDTGPRTPPPDSQIPPSNAPDPLISQVGRQSGYSDSAYASLSSLASNLQQAESTGFDRQTRLSSLSGIDTSMDLNGLTDLSTSSRAQPVSFDTIDDVAWTDYSRLDMYRDDLGLHHMALAQPSTANLADLLRISPDGRTTENNGSDPGLDTGESGYSHPDLMELSVLD